MFVLFVGAEEAEPGKAQFSCTRSTVPAEPFGTCFPFGLLPLLLLLPLAVVATRCLYSQMLAGVELGVRHIPSSL